VQIIKIKTLGIPQWLWWETSKMEEIKNCYRTWFPRMKVHPQHQIFPPAQGTWSAYMSKQHNEQTVQNYSVDSIIKLRFKNYDRSAYHLEKNGNKSHAIPKKVKGKISKGSNENSSSNQYNWKSHLKFDRIKM